MKSKPICTSYESRPITVLKYLALFSAICIMTYSVQGQTSDVYDISRIDALDFDGIINDKAWESITPVPLVQYSPDAGSPPTEKTEIRFAYDDDYFYASIKAYDREASKIRANSLYRDRLSGSDHFEILLDSYNDNETAYVFNTIPTGVRTDGAIANDATGGTISSSAWFNRDFNTFWDTKVTRDENGWYAEVRIPFSSLRFQNIDGKVIMGLSVQRKIARKLERLVFPNIPPENDWAFLKPSLAQKIMIEGIQPTKTVYITPYMLSGLERTNVLNEQHNGYQWDKDSKLDIGGDIKYSITNNLTADFTINTDFAQAEADDQLINLSRFSLFFPEKRQFFQERAAVFNFSTGGRSRLFFSRQIGLTGGGEAVPIIGGARLVGRMNTWEFGLLNMQTQSFDALGSENFGVFRIKRRAFNENSTVGGIFTSRIEHNGNRNYAYGMDGLIKVHQDDYLTVNWSQTFNEFQDDLAPADNTSNGRLTLELNRRRRAGLGYNLGFIYSGENYDPKLGFVDRSNFKFATSEFSQTWLHPEGHRFIWQQIGVNALGYWNNADGSLLSAEIGPEWSFSTRTTDSGSLGFKWNYENLLQDFHLSDEAVIPVGEYKFGRISARYSMAGEKILRTSVQIETGSFYDGWLNTLNISPSWFVSKHLELGLQYSFNHANFDERNQSFNIHIARLRVGTAVNNKLSTNAFVQYNSAADIFSANIRFRYNFKEGNDLWIVFNEGLNTDRFSRPPTLPPLPHTTSESVLLKYVHTFQISKYSAINRIK